MSRFQKAMVWLGLTDAESEDDYETYSEEGPPPRARHYRSDSTPPPPRVQVFQAPQESHQNEADNIRHLSNDRMGARPRQESRYSHHVDASTPPSASVSPDPRMSFVKPMPAEKPKLHLSQPRRFSDVQEIGDRFKERQVVLVDLQELSKDLSRRIIDFCSGATYCLEGRIEKLSEEVLLLSPANTEVSSHDKEKLLERLGSRTENP